MKPILLFLSVLWTCLPGRATSFAALDAPELGYREAIELAKQFFGKTEPDADKFYVFRAECGFHDLTDRRMWVVGFAKPRGAYGFVAVYMNGETRTFTSADSKRLYDANYTTPKQDSFRFTKPAPEVRYRKRLK